MGGGRGSRGGARTLGSGRSGMALASAGKGSKRSGCSASEVTLGVTSLTKADCSAGIGSIAASGSCGFGFERRRMSERRLPSPWLSPSSCSASMTGCGRQSAGEPAAADLSAALICVTCAFLARISASETAHGLVPSTPYETISRTRSSARRVCASPSALCDCTMSSAFERSSFLTAAGPAASESSARQRACHATKASAVIAYLTQAWRRWR